VGMAFPQSLPSRVPTGWLHRSFFIHTLYLAYQISYWSVRNLQWQKSAKLKSKKVPSSAGCRPLLIPLNAARNECELGWQCLIFEWSIADEPCTPDRVSFWEHRSLARSTVALPLHFAIEGCTLCVGPSPYR